MIDSGDTRIISAPSGDIVFKMSRCQSCGDYWIPLKQLEFMAEETKLPLSTFELCPDCRE
jgi:hypothetical protein